MKAFFFNSKRVRALILAVVMIALLAVAFPAPVSAGTVCFQGAWKGVTYDGRGEPHHYVQFYVDKDGADWKAYGPLWPSVWGYSGSRAVQAGYSWPYSWWDPYSARSWKVCRTY